MSVRFYTHQAKEGLQFVKISVKKGYRETNMRTIFKNIWARTDWHILPMTILGMLLLVAIYPLMRYAPAEWFVEDGVVENIQLLILVIAFGVALCAKFEHKMFVLVAFLVLFLIVREVNGGRAFFCARYLDPDEICRWNNMKYGYLADWIRGIFAIGVLIYALAAKLWQPIWRYVTKAPLYVWDFLLFAVAAVGAQIAETAYIDNEIMEEGMETVMYIMLIRLIWRYARVEVK